MESVARIYGATGTDENGVDGVDGNGDSYKEYATITAPVISRSLLSGDALSVGNAIAGQLKFAVMTTDTIPKSAKIVILARVKDDENVSEWLEFGTFWIDHRTVTDSIIDIEAYDAMKKGNQPYPDDSQTLNWPKTIAVVVTRIAEQMDVEIDSRTVTDVVNNSAIGGLNIITKPTDDMSLLIILQRIGEIIGGNWIITADNELRFVQIISPTDVNGYLLDHASEIVTTLAGNKLLWRGGIEDSVEAGVDTVGIGIVIGSLTKANDYVVTKVTMSRDSEHVYSYGSDTGYEVVIENNPYATDDLCMMLYNEIIGIQYSPYETTNSVYDPAAELGDLVTIGEQVCSVVFNETQELNIGFSADVSAPGRDEMEDEYPYQTFEQKTKYELKNIEDKVNSALIQTQEEITAYVSGISDSFLEYIVSDSLHYLVNNQSVGVTTGDGNWSQTFPTDNANKYLWTYHTYTISDGSSYNTEPKSYHVGNDDVVSVVPIYFAYPYNFTPPEPENLPIEQDEDVQGEWTTTIPTLSTDYRYLYTAEQYELENGLYESYGVRRINAVDAINKRVNTASVQITQYGVQISAIEENQVTKGSVRSDFALDPNSVTITAGQTESGRYTGTITFSGGAIVVNSDNFKVTSTGEITCEAGTIGGIHIGSDGIYSGVKTSYGNSSAGFYLGSDGSLGIGDNANYIKFYKPDPNENDYNLEINVDRLSWSATNSSMTADGTLTCSGASINGELYSAWNDPEGTIFAIRHIGNTLTLLQNSTICGMLTVDNYAFTPEVGTSYPVIRLCAQNGRALALCDIDQSEGYSGLVLTPDNNIYIDNEKGVNASLSIDGYDYVFHKGLLTSVIRSL